MLTADLVLARRRGAELHLQPIGDEARMRARAIAGSLIAAAEAHMGKPREDLEAAIDAIEVAPRETRWKAGLSKLLFDRCTWDEESGAAAPALRHSVFLRAAATRRALAAGERFDRGAVLDAAAAEHSLDAATLERRLYADLRGAQMLRAIESTTQRDLAGAWEHGHAQAVLLRATRITVDVRCATAGATRALFHRIKFLRLLHTITQVEDGYRLVIDGPYSLFESSTKYGLKLALVLPILDGCDAWKLSADVRWGKERTPLTFRLEGGGGSAAETGAHPSLPEAVADLARVFAALETGWRVAPSTAILTLPGVGLCVPDLVFERQGETVHLEVLGFWSREAVWRRVELVQAGLAEPILFAVSARLRVSEEVLAEDASSALYVYKGTMSARAIAEKIGELAKRVRQRKG